MHEKKKETKINIKANREIIIIRLYYFPLKFMFANSYFGVSRTMSYT